MKEVVFFAVLILTVFAADSVFSLQYQALAVQQSDLCNAVEAKCTNCTHIGLCIAIGKAPTVIPCTGSTPYCNERACATKPSSDCSGGTISSFTCPQTDGHYPDPNNCRLFHICVNKQATDYNCKDNAVYSTYTHSCVRQSVRNLCSKVNCNGKNGQYAVYPSDNRYAFFCVAGKSTGIMVKCDKDQIYNTEKNNCLPHCTQEGLLPDPDDNKYFIECTLDIGTNYIQTRRECPNTASVKTTFDPVKLECVISNKL